MEIHRVPVLVATIAILLGAIFLGAVSSFADQTQVEAQGKSKAFSQSWETIVSSDFASIVAIGLFDGSGGQEFISVLTSRPEVITLDLAKGNMVDKTRLRTTTFPVADQFFAQSRDGSIVAWLDLQKGGPVLVILSTASNQKQIISLDYTVPFGLDPSPTVISVGRQGSMIVIGDRNGVVALFEN